MSSDAQGWPGELELLDGFHTPERDVLGPFAWSHGAFRLRRRSTSPFLRADLCYYGDGGTLILRDDVGRSRDVKLAAGWDTYPLDFSGGWGPELDCHLSAVVPVAGDSRELGVMLRPARALGSAEDLRLLSEIAANRRRNDREFLAGSAELGSVPPQLRIGIETRCNLLPRCAYCEWDWYKSLEAASPLELPADRLPELGDFYRLAREVIDVSYGEPFLSPQLGAFLDACARDHKHVELTTNGTLLDQARRRPILGREAMLYFSIDAATAETYARYRCADFAAVLGNLRELCREKRAAGGRPVVVTSCIAMRSNAAELSRYVEAMAEAGADAVKLRPLFAEARLDRSAAARRGFDYASELMPPEEFRDLANAARLRAEALGIRTIVETEFCTEWGPAAPLCSEPWKTIYVLKRGIMPCCFAKEPLVSWSAMRGRPLPVFLAEVFSGPAYRELRAELAARRLPVFCRERGSCPIVARVLAAEREESRVAN